MQRSTNFTSYLLGAATVIALVMLTSYTEPHPKPQHAHLASLTLGSTNAAPDSLIPPQQVHAPHIPASVDFAGEPLPMDNFDAKERFDRELISNCFRHSATFLFFKMSVLIFFKLRKKSASPCLCRR